MGLLQYSRWFRQTKFPSFQRQLNIYGFTRITAGKSLNVAKRQHSVQDNDDIAHFHTYCFALFAGPDKGGYYHEMFLRGKQFLAERIARIKLKGTRSRKPSTPKNEPNFYRWPSLPAIQPSSPQINNVPARPAPAAFLPVQSAPSDPKPASPIQQQVLPSQSMPPVQLHAAQLQQHLTSGSSEAAMLDVVRGLSPNSRQRLLEMELARCLQTMNRAQHEVTNPVAPPTSNPSPVPRIGASAPGPATNRAYSDWLRNLRDMSPSPG